MVYQPPSDPTIYNPYAKPPPPPPSPEENIRTQFFTRRLRARLMPIVLIVVFLALVGGNLIQYWNQASQASTIISLRNQLATATQQTGQSSLDQFHQDVQRWHSEFDPLTSYTSPIQWKNSQTNPMVLGECLVVAETYRASAFTSKKGNTCIALNLNQRDIAVQVHMLLLEGNEAALAFLWSGTGENISNYSFRVQKNGSDGVWFLRKGKPAENGDIILPRTTVPGLFKDPGRPIALGIKAVVDDIDLYIDGKRIKHFHDSNSYGGGTIGLSTGQGPSEVMFSDAEIWTPNS